MIKLYVDISGGEHETYERAERYELDTMMVDCYAEKSYMFNRIDMAAKE